MTPTTPLYPVKVQEAIEKGLIDKLIPDYRYTCYYTSNGSPTLIKGYNVVSMFEPGYIDTILLPKPEAAEISEEEIKNKFYSTFTGDRVLDEKMCLTRVFKNQEKLDRVFKFFKPFLSLPSSNRQTEAVKTSLMSSCEVCGCSPNVIIITSKGTFCQDHAKY